MMHATLIIFGVLLPFTNAVFTVSLLAGDDRFITGQFSDSLLLSLPPCTTLAGQNVTLNYANAITDENKTLANIFTVPACQSKRNLTSNLAYQVTNLTSGTEYRFQYLVGSEKSNVLKVTTRAASDYGEIDDGLPARSGAMVVITVILSVAMFILLAGLIVAIALSSGEE